jgi:hypothetical protein
MQINLISDPQYTTIFCIYYLRKQELKLLNTVRLTTKEV